MYIQIERNSKIPLIRQIYFAVRQDILNGKLEKNTKLPSSRVLAKSLGVSRNVVLEAYEQLFCEGYIITREGSGTYVSENASLEGYHACSVFEKESILGLRHEINEEVIDFRTGVPDLSIFPIKKWGNLYNKVCSQIPALNLDYYEPRGCYELRYELVKYLLRARGVVCSPAQVFITTGAAQAFTLASAVLLGKNKHVVVEDPINKDIYKMLAVTKAAVHPVPADLYGIDTDELPKGLQPKLVFTTPSHQFPLGGILPINRRIALINYAKEANGYIIEDDYDSEFRFEGSPVTSFQSIAPERVIYIGTFSKILCPAFRIGYIILPSGLIDRFSHVKHLQDLHSPVLEQLALARFIKDGMLDRHINLSRKVYRAKNNLLKKCLKEAFNNRIKILGCSTGIHLVVAFTDIVFNHEIQKKLKNAGVNVPPVSQHTIKKGMHEDKIMLGYGNLSSEQIIEGVRRMSKCLS